MVIVVAVTANPFSREGEGYEALAQAARRSWMRVFRWWVAVPPKPSKPSSLRKKVAALYPDADKVYMEKRIRQETDGAYGIENLEQ